MRTKSFWTLIFGLCLLSLNGCDRGGDLQAHEDIAAACGGSPVTIDVLANDEVKAGVVIESVTISRAPASSLGAAAVNPDNTVTFTPAPGASGQGSFEYQVNYKNDKGESFQSRASVRVSLRETGLPPIANGDAATTEKGVAVEIDVLTNDTDPDTATGDALRVTDVTTPGNGAAVIIAAGQRIQYTPDATFTGTDTFQYTISDVCGSTATATVTVDIPVPPPAQALVVNNSNFEITVFVGDVEITMVEPNGSKSVEVPAGEDQEVRVEALLPEPDPPRVTTNLCKFESFVNYTITYTDNDVDPASVSCEITP